MDHYDYVWQRTKGIDPEHLFDGIPSHLWGDLAVSLYGEILSEVGTFFYHPCDVRFAFDVLMMISQILLFCTDVSVSRHGRVVYKNALKVRQASVIQKQ